MRPNRTSLVTTSLLLVGLWACSSQKTEQPVGAQTGQGTAETGRATLSKEREEAEESKQQSEQALAADPSAAPPPATKSASKKWEGLQADSAAAPRAPARDARRLRLASRKQPAEMRHPGDTYEAVGENAFKTVADAPLSTFGVDVDLASYSNVRRFLNEGRLPPKEAVRVEEMINYFGYSYPQPSGRATFAVSTERSDCPWQRDQQLLLIGLQARQIPSDKVPPRNLVFLVDVSGSMSSADKLGLVKKALKRMVHSLNKNDTVAVVTYAGRTGTALQPTRGDNKAVIINCIDSLGAGGSTNGAGGIKAAYDLAAKSFSKEHMNRVILVTDGDFNVGVSNQNALVKLIEQKRETGVFLTVVGVGRGNLRSNRMSALAKHGNGQYLYMDGEQEAVRQFEQGLAGTLVTVAKDVKLQVAFDGKQVKSYRLIGYTRRQMQAQDFRNDKKDSGELGAGHAVTALYQLEMQPGADADRALGEVRLRYEAPWAEKAKEEAYPIPGRDSASDNFGFAAAVAGFGLVLSGSEHAGQANLGLVQDLAQGAQGADLHGKRAEFLELVKKAKALEAAADQQGAEVGGMPEPPGGERRGG